MIALPCIEAHRDEALEKRLLETCQAIGERGVSVAMKGADGVAFASVGVHDSAGEHEVFDENSPVYVNCASRAFLATLMMDAVASDRLRLSDHLTDIVRSPAYDPPAQLRGIQLWQLLNHTHGLDGSRIHCVPRLADGRIDVHRLCHAACESDALAPPGRFLYNSGFVGSWLAAGALEITTGRRYQDLLFENLPFTLRGSQLVFGSANDSKPALDICPALGRDLAASTLDLMSFMSYHISAENMAELRAHMASFPGIPLGRHKTACGWYEFWDGWFGHNGWGGKHAVLLRFHPVRKLAMVVSSPSLRLAYYVLRDLFAELLPEFAQTAALLSMTDVASKQQRHTDCYSGWYQNAAWRIRVTPGRADALDLEIWPADASMQCIESSAHPGNSRLHVFHVTPSVPQLALDILQFIPGTKRDEFEYLWNGQFVWKRESGSRS